MLDGLTKKLNIGRDGFAWKVMMTYAKEQDT